MENCTRNALFTGLGFLIGTLGIKALTSEQAKKGYVHVMAQGMKCQAEYEKMVEQAKAEYDDMVAEARYIAVNGEGEKDAEAPAAAEA